MTQSQEVLLALLQGSKSTEQVTRCTGATYKTVSELRKKGMVSKRLEKNGKTRVAIWDLTLQGYYLAITLDNKKLSRFDRVKLYFRGAWL